MSNRWLLVYLIVLYVIVLAGSELLLRDQPYMFIVIEVVTVLSFSLEPRFGESMQQHSALSVMAPQHPEITEASRIKIFKPIFSAKPTGQGKVHTLTRDVVKRHGASYSLMTKEDG